MELKPVEGKIVLQFLEDEESEEAAMSAAPTPDGDAAIFAVVVGAGPKTKAKKGQTVLVRAWARGGTKVDGTENTVITDDYCVLAVVTG